MSKAMDVLHQRCQIHIFSSFNHLAAFRERFAHMERLDDIREINMSRFLKMLYHWNMLAFYRISPSTTHQYKVSRRAEKKGKRKIRRQTQQRDPTTNPRFGQWFRTLLLRRLPDFCWRTAGKVCRKLTLSRLRTITFRKIGSLCHRIAAGVFSRIRRLSREFHKAISRSLRDLVYQTVDGFLHDFTVRVGSAGVYSLSRRLLRTQLRRDARYRWYRRYFHKDGIDTVITANPLCSREYPALLAARDMGLRTVAVITSWDNLSSKRPLIIPFDEYLVWSPIMAREIKYFYHAKDAQVHEIGPTQFDHYFDERFIDRREDFCRRYGLDPSRKIVVYSTVTTKLLPDEPRIVEKLLLALKQGRVKGCPNLLIRLHPKRPMEDFRQVMEDKRWEGMPVAWTEAGKPVWDDLDLWCPMDDEIRLLTNTVLHGDVNLNCFSTMMLDFATLDKPAVLICHDGHDRKLRYELYEHLKPVLACKGNRTGYTFEQTLEHLNTYLEDPTLEREGRAAMVRMQCGLSLGWAWQRLVQAVLGDGVLPPPPQGVSAPAPTASLTPRATAGSDRSADLEDVRSEGSVSR